MEGVTPGTAHPPTSLRERQRREREELILVEAERMLGEVGAGTLSLDALAERVGIAKGTIYLHFPSKEDLLAAVIGRGIDRLIAILEGIAASPGLTAQARIEAIMRQMIEGHAGWVEFLQGVDPHKLKETLRTNGQLSASIARLFACVGAIIEEGKRAGEIDPEAQPETVALALFGAVRVITHASLALPVPIDMDDMSRSVIRLFFNGLLRRDQISGRTTHGNYTDH